MNYFLLTHTSLIISLTHSFFSCFALILPSVGYASLSLVARVPPSCNDEDIAATFPSGDWMNSANGLLNTASLRKFWTT